MRPIYCDLHNRIFRGHGITQVFRKFVFNFCSDCWFSRRHECNDHMQRVAFGSAKKEAAA